MLISGSNRFSSIHWCPLWCPNQDHLPRSDWLSFRTLRAESCKSVHLVAVDVDRETDLAMRFGVEAVPTIVLYAKGTEVARFQGIRSAAQLRAILRKELSRTGLRAST
ncbi:MAG: thioredoxin [Chromatiales bacterium]|nr:MAG: thioredoxin [Chromatiales bacterium]